MIPYRKDAIDSVIGRSSFGIWDLLNKGADPFGAPVRAAFEAEDAIRLLGKLSVPRISLHDIDVGLDPWITTDPKAFDARLKALQDCLRDAGVKVWMYTPCLFHHPVVRAGSVTANDARVRRASLRKMLTALDVAEEFDARWVTFWLGRDGAEVDALIDARAAYQRIAEAVHVCCAYIRSRGYQVRMTLEPKPNEPRGDIYIPTVGHALALIATLDKPDNCGTVPELAHVRMAGLNAYHEVAQALECGKLFGCHFNGQKPLRFDQDLRFGAEDLKESFLVVKLVEDAGWNGARTFDAHAYRTADREEVWDFVNGCMRSYLILREKVQQFHADAEIQGLLKELQAGSREPLPPPAKLKAITFDPNALAGRKLHHEKLDQLLQELLLGVR